MFSSWGLTLFKWKMLRESGLYALLFLQIFIALVTSSLVNDSASSRDISFTCFDTCSKTRTSRMYPLQACCTLVAGTLDSDILEADRARLP